jgi:DNA repair protein RecO (recombination protein O)
MPVHEAEAIVLRQYPFSDSNQVIVFFSRQYGKFRATAQGVRRTRSRIGACLEPLNHIRLAYYMREGRELGQVRQAELIHSYLGKNPSLDRICAFYYFAEIVNELAQDNQPNQPLFRLLLASLESGDRLASFEKLVRYFEVWCLKLSGFLPNYGYCSNCGKCVKDVGFFAWLEAGQARCLECAQGRGLRIGAGATAALSAMANLPPEQFGSLPLANDAAQELERLTQRLLGLHLEKQLKSYRLLKEALHRP